MRYKSVAQTSGRQDAERIDALTLEIARLVGHRAFSREQVVSSMLQRFLPDALRPWRGPDDLRRRLDAAGLDRRALDHLSANVATELAMAHARR